MRAVKVNLTLLQRFLIKGDHRRKLYGVLAKVTTDNRSWYSALAVMSVEFASIKHPLAPLAKIVLLRMRGAGAMRPGATRRTLGSELTGMVPSDEAMLIQAGELSGKIAAGLLNAADLVHSKERMRSAVIAALKNPVGYLASLLGVLVYISTSLLPQFEKTKPRANWTDDARLLGSVSDHINLIVVGTLLLLVAAGAFLRWLVPHWTGALREKADRYVFPFTLIAELNGAAFLKSLAGYISSGTAISEAVKNVSSTATPYMKEQCAKFMSALRRGDRAEEALCDLPLVPKKYHWVIKVYAMSDDAAMVYEDIANELTTNAEAFVNTLSGHVATAMKFGVGLLIIWIYGALNDIGTS